MDPELFFPVGESERYGPQTQEAKAVCANCSVRLQCGQWALDTGQDFGVWGGMSEKERRRIHRRKQQAAA